MRDVKRIAAYIREDGGDPARWLELVFAGAEQLTRFPHAGRILSAAPLSGIRQLLVGRHHLYYLALPTEIEIRAVRHARQNWDPRALTLL